MKIIRYLDENSQVGYACLDESGNTFRLTGTHYDDFRATDEPVEPRRLLAPVAPAVIFGIGLNYRQHAEETGKPLPEYPLVFMKASTALQHPGEPIVLPRHLRSEKVDAEAELAIVIGKHAKNVPPAEALDYVAGYTCANDVSARDWQFEKGGGQFCKGKTFDTFCPLGPCLVTPESLPDPGKLALRQRYNGKIVQESNTNDLIFSVADLISFLSGSTTLAPGTVILTGTPGGVGAARQPQEFLQPGDTVTVEIDGIGMLTNPVVEEA